MGRTSAASSAAPCNLTQAALAERIGIHVQHLPPRGPQHPHLPVPSHGPAHLYQQNGSEPASRLASITVNAPVASAARSPAPSSGKGVPPTIVASRAGLAAAAVGRLGARGCRRQANGTRRSADAVEHTDVGRMNGRLIGERPSSLAPSARSDDGRLCPSILRTYLRVVRAIVGVVARRPRQVWRSAETGQGEPLPGTSTVTISICPSRLANAFSDLASSPVSRNSVRPPSPPSVQA